MGTKEYKIGAQKYFAYGLGNFASQLSWTMVSTYLAVFYTDVFGLTTGAVAILFLVAKIWDGINDPMMGEIMEHTHSKWGRFRPYIVIGAPLLVIFTILTFTVPNFDSPYKLIYAYVTYIGLGMIYTMTNVPYQGLPAVMTTDGGKINRLMTSQMMGMVLGMIILNLGTLPLVNLLGGGDQKIGYQYTAALFAVLALPMFWYCAAQCKETVVVHKEHQVPVKESMKLILGNRNLMMVVLYTIANMTAMMGRIGVAVYFYMYVVKDFRFITLFMMMQMLVGAVVMPFSPRVIERHGKKAVVYFSLIVQAAALLIMAFGPKTNIPFLIVCHILYGSGYIAGPCGSIMLCESLDEMDLKTGVRTDGTAFSLNGLGSKIGSAVGSALGVAVIGWFGYKAGGEITPTVSLGINVAVNIVPACIFLLGIIPVAIYSLDEKKVPEIRKQLKIRNEKREEELVTGLETVEI
ncbi:glycoside/pentoside/hexuronide:cation symporter, GPH family/glucuronide carrier protein [Lachnospiraceae bacterium KH1T2]|nr:glycoside/pentoside/hexuronide:cation symporter, GPH family/glucuronide carrier protein [Lachnospiraceae bacterium KH1T2]